MCWTNICHSVSLSNHYNHILDNFVWRNVFPTPFPAALKQSLNWPTNVTENDLEKEIWKIHWELHPLRRNDPDPHIKIPGGTNLSFGLTEDDIKWYTVVADQFHRLLLYQYGSSGLYPYAMKRKDTVLVLLKELPFHGLFRCSTEGGEHAHYLHQCLFYDHSSHGGGWVKEDLVLTTFKWFYRQITQRISGMYVDNHAWLLFKVALAMPSHIQPVREARSSFRIDKRCRTNVLLVWVALTSMAPGFIYIHERIQTCCLFRRQLPELYNLVDDEVLGYGITH